MAHREMVGFMKVRKTNESQMINRLHVDYEPNPSSPVRDPGIRLTS